MRHLLAPVQRLAAALNRWSVYLHAGIYAGRPGQGLVEYGLILVLIMVVCVGILSLVGKTLSTVWYARLFQRMP